VNPVLSFALGVLAGMVILPLGYAYVTAWACRFMERRVARTTAEVKVLRDEVKHLHDEKREMYDP